MKTGLVLEGGGMRGIYTIGVLDAMMEHDICADYVIGVSAGACSGISYVSKQQYRSYRIDEKYLADKRYVSMSNFLRTRSVFGMDFIFSEVPKKLDPFDMETFLNNPTEFKVGVTEVATGKPVYFGKQDNMDDMCTLLAASSSIPMFSPEVRFQGKAYLDGGTSDPIPVKQALKDGCDRMIVVRTRDRSYRKSPEAGRTLYQRAFRKTPEMISCINKRHIVYNQEIACCDRLEKLGKVMILAPEKPITISRFENNIRVLDELYREGWQAVELQLDEIRAFFEADK